MKRLITICLVATIILGISGVVNAVPTVTPPPGAPDWWNSTGGVYYAYAWWKDLPNETNLYLDDAVEWTSNFIVDNTDFYVRVYKNNGNFHVQLKNVPDPNLYKEIYIYAEGTTSDYGATWTIPYFYIWEDENYSKHNEDAFIGTMEGTNNGDGTWSFLMDGEIHPQPYQVNVGPFLANHSDLVVTNLWIGENCIPEPATIAMLGLGGLLLRRKRR
jgi:hypothetical protein